MSIITRALLLAAKDSPAGVTTYGSYLAASADARGITSRNSVIALLMNGLNESGGLANISEDLYYKDAAWIAQVFSSHFPGGAKEAASFVANPRALGNRVYAGIGPAQGGYAARGLGLGQVTGDAVHQAYASDVGMTLANVRSYLLTPAGAADSLCWYFQHFKCGIAAEAGDFLRVRQIWAGSHSTPPMGWGTDAKPGPVQVWGAQVKAAFAPTVVSLAARQVTAPIVAPDSDPPEMGFPT